MKAEVEILTVSHRLPQAAFDLGQQIIANVTQRYAKAYKHTGRKGTLTYVNHLEDIDLHDGTWLVLARNGYQLEAAVRAVREQAVVYTLRGKPTISKEHIRAIQAYEALRGGKAVSSSEAALVLVYMGRQRPLNEGREYTAAGLDLHDLPIWHDGLTKMNIDDREYYLACRRRDESLTGTPRIRIDTIHGAKGLEADKVALALTMSPRNWRGFERDPDAEHRVFYTGVTRTREDLFVIEPQGKLGYHF